MGNTKEALKQHQSNGCLSRDAIFASDDLPVERVDVPEWGGYVYIRTLTAAERDQWEQEMVDMKTGKLRDKLKTFRANLCVRTVCDAIGNRLFSDNDISALSGKSAKVLDRLFEKAQQINRLSDADVEELVGN